MSIFSRIAGTGSYLPALRLTNQDLVERLAKSGLETSDEWITTRSGISARHFAAENELTSDLAVKAAQAALTSAGITSADLDSTIQDLSKNLGITFVIVSHELASIYAIADKVIMLDKASKGIIAEGDPKVLRDTSTDPRVHQFFNRITTKDAA